MLTTPASAPHLHLKTANVLSIHGKSVHLRAFNVKIPSRGVLSPTCIASSSTLSETKNVWKKLETINRDLEVAVSREDYQLAVRLRDDAKSLREALSPVQQYMYHHVSVLQGSGTTDEKLKAILALGEAGDNLAIPCLAACLRDGMVHEAAHSALWQIFMRHHDPQVQDLMTEGAALMSHTSFHHETLPKAVDVFTRVTELDPDYAEGYNRRATVRYMMRMFPESIEDCTKTLQLMPQHFGAASGMGLCHMQLGEVEKALVAFDLALEIYPHLTNIAKLVQDLRRKQDQ